MLAQKRRQETRNNDSMVCDFFGFVCVECGIIQKVIIQGLPSNLGKYGAEPKRNTVRPREQTVSNACLWGMYFSFQMSHLQCFIPVLANEHSVPVWMPHSGSHSRHVWCLPFFFAASSSILSGIFWLLLVFTNVGNPITKLACGNGLYHPCMIVLGMV